jgi:hypothetical protein
MAMAKSSLFFSFIFEINEYIHFQSLNLVRTRTEPTRTGSTRFGPGSGSGSSV